MLVLVFYMPIQYFHFICPFQYLYAHTSILYAQTSILYAQTSILYAQTSNLYAQTSILYAQTSILYAQTSNLYAQIMMPKILGNQKLQKITINKLSQMEKYNIALSRLLFFERFSNVLIIIFTILASNCSGLSLDI